MTLDLGQFLRQLWSAKKMVVAVTTVTFLAAILTGFLLPTRYKAEALLAPSQTQGFDSMSGVAGQYGALLNSVGINAGGSGVKKTDLGLEILKSRKFIADFIARHDLLPALMAGKGWDAASGELKYETGSYDASTSKWLSKGDIPSSHDAYEEFIEILSVSEDKVSGFVRIGITHYSPIIAKDWVHWLVKDLNATILRQDVAEAEQAIAYLKQQAENTPLAGLQSVFFRLIEEQTKTVMLAQAKAEYLFATVDPAVVPQERHSPKRLLITFAGFLLGLALSALIVLFSKNFDRD